MRHVPLICLSFEKHALRLMQTVQSVHLSWEVLLLQISWQCFARVLRVEICGCSARLAKSCQDIP